MKNIVICNTTFGWLTMPLAEKLKRETGATMHFICTNRQQVRHWKDKDSNKVIDDFTIIDHFYFDYDKVDAPSGAVFAEAGYFEKKYGVLVVDTLQADRHLGRGFSSGGTGHPRSKLSEKADYVKSANQFNRAFRFWERYIEQVRPDLVIGLPSGGMVRKIMAVVLRHNGIPLRRLYSSRYASYSGWTADEYFLLPEIEKNFREMSRVEESAGEKDLEQISRLPTTAELYANFSKCRSVFAIMLKISAQIKRDLWKRINRISSIGNYKLSEDIRYIIRIHRELKLLDSRKMTTLDELEGKSYFIYPLHVEPEVGLGVFSPEFNEQMALIQFIAKNLPAGTFLVVKEHLGGVGKRPKDYYRTISEIPNVLMVSPYEYAVNIAKKARGVIIISGTLGGEAAIFGIPVISFGLHNNYNFLPHVHVVRSWKELRPLLHYICTESDPENVKKMKEDGLRYLAALKTASMNLEGWDLSAARKKEATPEEIEVMYSSLMKTLAMHKEEQYS